MTSPLEASHLTDATAVVLAIIVLMAKAANAQ